MTVIEYSIEEVPPEPCERTLNLTSGNTRSCENLQMNKAVLHLPALQSGDLPHRGDNYSNRWRCSFCLSAALNTTIRDLLLSLMFASPFAFYHILSRGEMKMFCVHKVCLATPNGKNV